MPHAILYMNLLKESNVEMDIAAHNSVIRGYLQLGDLDQVAHASAELTRASVEFEVRSPSLEDVYLAHAGNRSAGGGDP